MIINYYDLFFLVYVGVYVISWVIINGEIEYGVSWYIVEFGIDIGDIFKFRKVNIENEELVFVLNLKC